VPIAPVFPHAGPEGIRATAELFVTRFIILR